MKKMLRVIGAIYIGVLFLGIGQTNAQTDSTHYIIKTTDGNTYKGKVVGETDSLLHFDTFNLGEIRITKSFIVSKAPLWQKKESAKYWYTSPHNTRYFFLPNGYNLKSKTAYYQNSWVLANQASLAMGNNFTCGFGLIPLFLFGGPTPIWITPKVSVPIIENKVNLGAGVLLATVIGEGGGYAGLIYALGTFGSPDQNLTVGGGYSIFDGELGKLPLVSLGGMSRISENNYLLSENYLLLEKNRYAIYSPDYTEILRWETETEARTVLSFGLRNVKPKLAIDYGLIIPINFDIGTFIAIPWLGITVPFKTRQ